MILEAIWTRSSLRVLMELLKAGEFAILSARELARRTGLSTPTGIEAANNLIALGLLEKVNVTPKREYFKLKEFSILRPFIEELIEVGERFEEYLEDRILEYIDDVLKGDYYIGSYWAAMADIDPIDYSPNIFVIFTKRAKWISPLNFSRNIYVGEISKWKPPKQKSIYIAISEDIGDLEARFGVVKGFKVKVTSVERGIAQLFKWNIYPYYATALALLQNKDMGRLKEEKLLRIAKELGVDAHVKAVSYYVEIALNKKVFDRITEGYIKLIEEGTPNIYWGLEPKVKIAVEDKIVAIDPTPIHEAITTVYG